jgi:hypothetical protein
VGEHILKDVVFKRFKMKKMGLFVATVFFLVSFQGCAGATGKRSEGTSTASGQTSVGTPTALRLVIVPNGFKLTWKPPAEASGAVTGYEIIRSDLASGPFTTVAKVDKGVTDYIDTTASPEIIYYYKVRAVAGTTYSPYSNTVTGER